MDPINNTASALGHPQCLASTSKGLDIYEWMVIKVIPLKGRQSVFGTLWSPGMSGTGRLSAWSTGCPLHDLTTSQAALGKKVAGEMPQLIVEGQCLSGYRWRLCSGFSKAEPTLRPSKMPAGFKTGPASFPSLETRSGDTHQVMLLGHYQQPVTSDLGKAFVQSDLNLLPGVT